MTQKQKENQKNILAEEISNRLVDYNLDLYTCEQAEQYEQAALINTTINLFISNSAQLLSKLTGGAISEIFDGIKEQSNEIFEAIKKNNHRLATL